MCTPPVRNLLPLLILITSLPISAQPPAPSSESHGPFDPFTAALEELSAVVEGYVAQDLAVGAELLIIENGRVALQAAFGWQDRESGRELAPNSLFNIRSLTRPLTGAAVQILVDEGRLRLDDPVALHLPSFDTEMSEAITVRHLLTHTSGLPLSIVHTFAEFPSLLDLADRAGLIGPQVEPGSAFRFSDTGLDVLGALVERVSGVSLDRFLRERLLDPLGMEESLYLHPGMLHPEGEALQERIATSYRGQQGNWIRLWKPGDPPPYPYALGSQGLYCSARDYARFLSLWLHGGRTAGGEEALRLLSERAVRDTLTPVHPATNPASTTAFPTGFPGLRVYYGQTAFQYLPDGDDGTGEPVVVGYTWMDGSSAWVWPQRGLMILLFTQSRGTSVGLRLEWEIDRLLIHPGRHSSEVPDRYRPYLGTYLADFGPHDNERFTVLFRDGRLAVDIPSQWVYLLQEPDPQERWRFELAPEEAVSFHPIGDEPARFMKIHRGGEEIQLPREGTAAAARQEQQRRMRIDGWRRFLGIYRDEEQQEDLEIVLRGGRLALLSPDGEQYLLLPPTAGRWAFLVNPAMHLRFEEGRNGGVQSMTISLPEGDRKSLPRVADPLS